MADLAHPLRFPTQSFPGYHGQQPFTIAQQEADAPLRARHPVWGPPTMVASTGIQNRKYTRTKAYTTRDDPPTMLPDFHLFSHPVIQLTPTAVPFRAALQQGVQEQLYRNYPSAPITSYSAPSTSEIAAFLGGVQRG